MPLETLAWFLPIAVLPLCVYLTRSLASDDPIEMAEPPPRPPRRAMLTFVVAVVCLCASPFFPPSFSMTFAIGMLGLALWVRALAAKKRAARAVLHHPILSYVWLHAVWLVFLGMPHEFPSFVRTTGGLAYTGLVLALSRQPFAPALQIEDPEPLRRRTRAIAWVLLVGGAISLANQAVYGTPSQLRRFASSFDDSPAEIGDWRAMGWATVAARQLGETVENARATEAIRAAMHRADDLHPSTIKGAMTAGMLRPEDWAVYRKAERFYRRAGLLEDPEEGFSWSLRTPVDLAALRADPTFTPAEAQTLATKLSQSWPRPRDLHALQYAREIADLLTAMGRTDLIAAHRADLHAILRETWCPRATMTSPAGGFSGYAREDGSRRSDRRHTLHAVVLMTYVGVPDGIDLASVEAYTARESKPTLLFSPFSQRAYDVPVVVAGHTLRMELASELERARSPLRHACWLTVLAPLLFVGITWWRAPVAAVRRADDAGPDQPEDV